MELHTLGVDGGYTQKDVTEVARGFTGWTIQNPRMGGDFRFEPRIHDTGEKVVLGHIINAGGGESDGEKVLDILAAHPSTARFIATKLARRFVSDTPPASLVDRAAKRFRDTGGDLREVTRTILTSQEFLSASARGTKIKTPFEFVVSALRTTGTDVTDATLFVRAMRGEFDAVIACYHDQGLVPVKLVAFGQAVNVTLGLPIIRTSVDHGTAFDIAGQGRADPGAMVAAFTLAVRMASSENT
jgi:uncharacterized protein (DUF1800 family)